MDGLKGLGMVEQNCVDRDGQYFMGSGRLLVPALLFKAGTGR